MAEILELTDAQQEILVKFKHLFKKELDEKRLNDSVFLLRWLIARDFDVRKAEQMLKNSLNWRWENNIDGLLTEEFPENYEKDYPYKYQGQDKDGRIVCLFPWGRWDLRSACESGEKEQLIRYSDTIFELGQAKSAATPWVNRPGKFHSQVVVLCNMEGFSYRQLAHRKTIETLLDLVHTYNDHYPESLFRAVIFNAPWIFSILFAMMKQILTMRTISKVSVFSSNRTEWEPVIREIVDSDQIPLAYGGTQPDIFDS